jgi:hypothetical protein
VKAFRELQRARGGATPPAVVVMASFLEELKGELTNVSGVAYEVPGVTAFVHLRAVIAKPVTRVGVLHRPGFKHFIERQKALAEREQIALVPVEVGADPTASEVREALRQLRAGPAVDALWILNDNALLRDARFLESAWRSEIKALGLPVVVGVPSLVTAKAGFGTFAVLPDHEALVDRAVE